MANVEIQQPNADAHDFSDAYHFDARTDERPPRDVKRIVVVGTVVPDFIFKGFTKLTHVHLPESVEHIGWSAFEECRSLKTITLPRYLRQIEGHAFLRSGLESVSIPDRCSIIGCHVFAYCEQLKSISFPKNDALDIEMACCQGCSSLVACDLGSGMKQLNNSFFEKCCSLEEIHLPSSIVRIGCDSFDDASALKEINLHDNIVHISDGSFSGCKNLRKVRLPNNANTFIGNNAFKNCSSLLQIVRPEKIPDSRWMHVVNSTNTVNRQTFGFSRISDIGQRELDCELPLLPAAIARASSSEENAETSDMFSSFAFDFIRGNVEELLLAQRVRRSRRRGRKRPDLYAP